MAYLSDSAPRPLASGPPATPAPAAAVPGAPRRLAWLRPLWAVAGFVVVTALASAMAYYAYDANRRLENLLSGKVGEAERRLAGQIRNYFNPAQQFLEIASVAAYGRDVTEGGWEIGRLA